VQYPPELSQILSENNPVGRGITLAMSEKRVAVIAGKN